MLKSPYNVTDSQTDGHIKWSSHGRPSIPEKNVSFLCNGSHEHYHMTPSKAPLFNFGKINVVPSWKCVLSAFCWQMFTFNIYKICVEKRWRYLIGDCIYFWVKKLRKSTFSIIEIHEDLPFWRLINLLIKETQGHSYHILLLSFFCNSRRGNLAIDKIQPLSPPQSPSFF